MNDFIEVSCARIPTFTHFFSHFCFFHLDSNNTNLLNTPRCGCMRSCAWCIHFILNTQCAAQCHPETIILYWVTLSRRYGRYANFAELNVQEKIITHCTKNIYVGTTGSEEMKELKIQQERKRQKRSWTNAIQKFRFRKNYYSPQLNGWDKKKKLI